MSLVARGQRYDITALDVEQINANFQQLFTDVRAIVQGLLAGDFGGVGGLTLPITDLTIGGVLTAAGGQIAFPAAQNAAAGANVLDDYEEGAWTPALVGATSAGTQTYSSQTGVYVKIGRYVFLVGNLALTAKTLTGVVRLSGLPFVAASDALMNGGIAMGYFAALNANWLFFSGHLVAGASYVVLGGLKAAGATFLAADGATDIAATTDLRFCISYLAAA